MSEVLENELRAAFAERAGTLPAHAGERLRQIDYRPRSRILRPRVAIGAGAGLAATGGVVVALVGLGAGASPAFAGWTPTPTTPAGGETAGALASCDAQLAGTGAPQSSIPTGDWQAVLTDTRGPFTAMILESGSASATCFSGPSFTSIAASAQGGGGSQHVVGVGRASGSGLQSTSVAGVGVDTSGAGPISQASQTHLTTGGGQPYTSVQGQIGPTVTAVTIVLADGSGVQATVAGGAFIAWWPSAADAASAQVETSSGMTTQPFTFTALPTPPSGGSGGASTP
ncbi:MAG: hypothetical protein ABR947_10590 [Solirubrobacteraceae bacterium]|jgi:hypothetical protein